MKRAFSIHEREPLLDRSKRSDRWRARAGDKGWRQQNLQMSADAVALLDRVKQRRALASRSAALESVLQRLMPAARIDRCRSVTDSHSLQTVNVLMSDAMIAQLDRLKDSHALPNRSVALCSVLGQVLENSALLQELGL